MIQSMSRARCCIDNGPIEGIWGIIKSEMYYISDFNTEEELREAIREYIDYYNNGRYQERYDNLTPTDAAMQSKLPKQYPIPINKRIENYRAKLAAKQQSA